MIVLYQLLTVIAVTNDDTFLAITKKSHEHLEKFVSDQVRDYGQR